MFSLLARSNVHETTGRTRSRDVAVTRRMVPLGAVLLLVATGCQPDTGDCPEYLACTESLGQPSALLEATYGADGTCWNGKEDEQKLCRAACTDYLATLEAAYGDCEVHDCQGHSLPQISTVTLTNAGMVEDPESGDTHPSVEVGISVTDGDGNLNTMVVDLWFEDDADGSVDDSRTPDVSSTVDMGTTACASPEATTAIRLDVVGRTLEVDTRYDVGARVTDAEGDVSDVAITQGYTPKSDGSDGG